MSRSDSLFAPDEFYNYDPNNFRSSKPTERNTPMPEPVVIPPVPEGVLNPSNLYNDAYADRPPLAWANPEFHDKIAWIGEHVTSRVEMWFAVRNSSPETSFLGPTMAHMVVLQTNGEIIGSADVDSLNFWLNPDLVVHMLLRSVDANYEPTQIAPYPGYDARHPAGSNPIGPPLLKQPWPGRTLYMDVAPSEYAVGAQFQDPTGSGYTKVSYISAPGKGPFGTGGKTSTAWEMTYKV